MATVTVGDHVSQVSQRYYGLDALRAWAMSMGIVLHAAWIMTPGESGAPMTDVSASTVTSYIDAGIHMFRMQLFFLLAGFFACLLVRKRGVGSFLRNRFYRIAVPLVVFWFVLWPSMFWQFQSAQLKSGALLSDQTAWQLTLDYLAEMTPKTTMTMHMWFIYYLCWIYLMVIAIRWLLSWVDRQGVIRQGVSDRLGSWMQQPWGVVVLALASASLMYPMQDMYGIEMDAFTLYPVWAGLFSYLLYFLVGWVVYRNVEHLPRMVRGWRWQLTVGVLLTLVYFGFIEHVTKLGYTTPQYPNLTVRDVRWDDASSQRAYPQLRSQLMESDSDSIAGRVWAALPENRRAFVQSRDDATENMLTGLLTDIGKTSINEAGFATGMDLTSLELPPELQRIASRSAAERSEEEVSLLNRKILEAGFAGNILGEDVDQPFYRPIRAAYCVGYSLTTWLMIFGCLGFTQRYFSGESRFWRYFSDASYWMYLMHLVPQFPGSQQGQGANREPTGRSQQGHPHINQNVLADREDRHTCIAGRPKGLTQKVVAMAGTESRLWREQ